MLRITALASPLLLLLFIIIVFEAVPHRRNPTRSTLFLDVTQPTQLAELHIALSWRSGVVRLLLLLRHLFVKFLGTVALDNEVVYVVVVDFRAIIDGWV